MGFDRKGMKREKREAMKRKENENYRKGNGKEIYSARWEEKGKVAVE